MKMRPIRLLSLFMLSFAILAIVIISVSGINNYRKFKSYTIENLNEYGSLLCEDLSFMAVDLLFSEAYPSLDYLVNEFSGRRDVSNVSIVNTADVIVADNNSQNLGKTADWISELDTELTTSKINDDESEIRFISPVNIDKMHLGYAVLAISLEQTNIQLRNLMRQSHVTGLIFFVIYVSIGIILTQIIISPVGKLIDAIYESSSGNYRLLKQDQWIHELSELRAAYNTMVKRLDERENQLKTARNDAELANSAKSKFLANISHELRTPLNGILGFASLLSDSGLTDEQLSMLENISASGESLTLIIRNLLDLIELETGICKLSYNDFNIESIFKNIDINTRIMLDKKPVEFSYSIDGCSWMNGDRERIEQILVLLINNSVKFTESGSIKLNARWDDDLIVTLTDTGIGIPADQLKNVFDHLYQVENPLIKTHEGIGVGLSIVKMLVTFMKGSIELESSIGGGVSVYIRLPLTECAEIADIEETYKVPLNAERRILLVEDEAVNRMYLEMVLTKNGYLVDGVTDGSEAIEKFSKGNYGLILMDLGLPGISGIDTSKRIFELEKYKLHPIDIIPVTASTEAETRRRCEDIGLKNFISKPVREDHLLELIHSSLEANS